MQTFCTFGGFADDARTFAGGLEARASKAGNVQENVG